MPLDIAAGIFISLFIAYLYGVTATPIMIVVGILSALLPDIDMILRFARRHSFAKNIPERFEYDHRTLPHYPVFYIPIIFLVYVWFGSLWATLFGFGAAFHLVHDTVGIGWGVSWLWPFSTRRFLFPEKGRRNREGFFMAWTEKEESALAVRYHNPHWVRDFYFKPNAIAFIEWGGLILSITALFFYFNK